MKTHDYPKEVTEENFKELVERAQQIVSKSSKTFGISVIVSILLLGGLVIYFLPLLRVAQTVTEYAEISLAISFGLALFVSVFLIDFVNITLRRIFNNIISYYPSPEEFIFAQCILTANLFDKAKKSERPKWIRYRSMYLAEEFSRFSKYDILNFRRKFYRAEFRLLASGETEIGRMLMFSEAAKKETLTKFALALVNDDDPNAFLLLKDLISEIEKYGELKVLAKRIENQLRNWKSIVAIVGGTVAIIATIIELLIL